MTRGGVESNLQLHNQLRYQNWQVFLKIKTSITWDNVHLQQKRDDNVKDLPILESDEPIRWRNENQPVLQTTQDITNIKGLPDQDYEQLIGFNFVKKYNRLEQ